MILVIHPHVKKIADGNYTTSFSIWEDHGEASVHTPYYLEKKFADEKEAYGYARQSAVAYASKRYPKEAKYKIEDDRSLYQE